MEDVFILIEEQFRTHFVHTVIITVSIGVMAVSLFALAIMRSNRHRVGQYPKQNSVSKFSPDITLPGPWQDQIAQRDRDLEKWRKEHKGQLEQ
jgi:hypothetical protein